MSWMIRQSCRASPGGSTALVDLDDATFDLRDDSFVLFVQRARQHDVGVMRRFVQKEIDRHIKLQFSSIRATKLLSGSETIGLKQIESSPLNLAAINLAKDLVSIDAGARHLCLVNAPDLGDIGAMLRIADVASPGKLIAFLSMFASPCPLPCPVIVA